MQRGVVQALNTGPQAMVENSMWEIGKHYYAIRLEPGGAWTCTNDSRWSELPTEYQAVLMEEGVNYVEKIQGWYDTEADKQKARLAEKGITIHEPTKAEMDAWRNAAQPIWNNFAQQNPKNKQALDLVKKALGY